MSHRTPSDSIGEKGSEQIHPPSSEEKFQRIGHCFPTQRGDVKLPNLNISSAVPYMAFLG